MAEEKYGIQETKELLSFVFSLAEAIKSQTQMEILIGEMALILLNPSKNWAQQ